MDRSVPVAICQRTGGRAVNTSGVADSKRYTVCIAVCWRRSDIWIERGDELFNGRSLN